MLNHKKNLGINALLNAFRNCLSIIFPLITYPYAFRILHAEGMGSVNYAQSIVSYFTLIAGLGISLYATREGAKIRDQQTVLNNFANQVFTINVISTIISYILLAICLICIDVLKPYRWLILLSSVSIGFTTLGVEWINTIFEDYFFITIRSILINLMSLVLLFVFVKNEQDYYKYAALTVFSNIAVCFLNWRYCRKYVKIRITRNINLKRHLPPTMSLFVNSIAVNVYASMGTTITGGLAGTYYVGIYEVASKIYTVIKRILAAIYAVAIPRVSFYLGQGNTEEVKKIYTSVFSCLSLIMLPASVGLICVAEEIILLMGGREYLSAVPTLRILSLALVGAIYGGMVTYCINIPLKREKINIKATMLSAIINLIVNVLTVPVLKQNGAACSVLVSEYFVFIYCVMKTKDIYEFVNVSDLFVSVKHACFGSIFIIIISLCVHLFNLGTIISLLLIIAISVISYIIILIGLKDRNVMSFLKKFFKKIQQWK